MSDEPMYGQARLSGSSLKFNHTEQTVNTTSCRLATLPAKGSVNVLLGVLEESAAVGLGVTSRWGSWCATLCTLATNYKAHKLFR
jgi:hypothetical protein